MTTSYHEPTVSMNPVEGYDSSPGTVPQRKKLLLKPRSVVPASHEGIPRLDHRKVDGSMIANPFGLALPREAVLQQRGIQVSTLDEKFERKAKIRHYTVEQDLVLDRVRAELEEITANLRRANEHELPEEVFRQAEQDKRIELNDLLEEFARINDTETKASAISPGDNRRIYQPRGVAERRSLTDKDFNTGHQRAEDKGLRRSHESNRLRQTDASKGERRNTWTHTGTSLEEKKMDDGDTQADIYGSFLTNRKRRDE